MENNHLIMEQKGKANIPVRSRAKERNVPLWLVAEKYGKSSSWFYVMLRHEFPEKVQRELIAIIDRIADEREKVYDL